MKARHYGRVRGTKICRVPRPSGFDNPFYTLFNVRIFLGEECDDFCKMCQALRSCCAAGNVDCCYEAKGCG